MAPTRCFRPTGVADPWRPPPPRGQRAKRMAWVLACGTSPAGTCGRRADRPQGRARQGARHEPLPDLPQPRLHREERRLPGPRRLGEEREQDDRRDARPHPQGRSTGDRRVPDRERCSSPRTTTPGSTPNAFSSARTSRRFSASSRPPWRSPLGMTEPEEKAERTASYGSASAPRSRPPTRSPNGLPRAGHEAARWYLVRRIFPHRCHRNRAITH